MSDARPKVLRPWVVAAFLICGAVWMLALVVNAQCTPDICTGGLRWRMIGPFRAGRVNAVSGVVGQPETFYFGSVGGGVWKTNNAGRTWKPVFDSQSAASIGAIGVAPSDANVVYVGTGEADMRDSIQFGDGMYKSTDGGTTWKEIDAGIPVENRGRIGISVAPTNRNRVYAMVDAKEGGLFVSNDAGATWTRNSSDKRVWDRGWYFEKVVVDPKNADIVYASNTSVYRSTDAGKTWTAIKGAPGGDDYHQLWIYPDDPKRMVLGSDQGAIVTVDGAETWSSWYNQSTAQIYHVAADRRVPYWVTGAQQDSGAIGTPSRSRHSEISNRDWEGLCSGGESGYTAPDPLHPEILFGGTVSRCNVLTGETKNASPERGGGQMGYRHDWTQPLVLSRADPHGLYYGHQVPYQNNHRGG